MVLGKTRFGGFFFACRKVSRSNRNTADPAVFLRLQVYEAINWRNT